MNNAFHFRVHSLPLNYSPGQSKSLVMGGFFEEVKRRKVYRVAAAYVIAAGGDDTTGLCCISGVGLAKLGAAPGDRAVASRLSNRSRSLPGRTTSPRKAFAQHQRRRCPDRIGAGT